MNGSGGSVKSAIYLRMIRLQNLIFDWSGTLVDDLGPVIEATNYVLSIYGKPSLDRESFRLSFRLPYSGFYEELLPGVDLAELEDHFRESFYASKKEVTVLAGAREALEWCHARQLRCFVLSSMDKQAFQRQLADLDLGSFFEETYAGVLDKRDRIGELLEIHNLAPENTAFIGDMVHDVETAQHGGLTSIAVLTGYTSAAALALAKPDVILTDLTSLTRLVDRLKSFRHDQSPRWGL